MSTGSEELVPLTPISESARARTASVATPTIAEVTTLAETLNAEDRLRLIAEIWSSLPPWHSAAPRSRQLTDLRQCLDDFDAGRVERFPWAAVQRMMVDGSVKPPSRIYSAPRRFDLATIFIVTLAYSLLFGVMKAVSFPGVASLVIAAFISFVALGQAFLFGGNQPRTSSMIVGTSIFVLTMLAGWIISGPRIDSTGFVLIMICQSIIGGAILGYLSGVLIGGVFLVADKLRNYLSRKHNENNDDQSAGTSGGADTGGSPWTN